MFADYATGAGPLLPIRSVNPQNMKRCEYCGQQNEETVATCGGCGTPLSVERPPRSSEPTGVLRTAKGVAVTTGLGVVILSTAMFFVVGRAAGELGLLGGKPAGEMYSFFTSALPAPLVLLAVVFPTLALCRARCLGRRMALTTACVTLVILATLALLPLIVPIVAAFWCVPAFLFFQGSGSSGACYAGAALQLALGAWLLLWFRPRGTANEAPGG